MSNGGISIETLVAARMYTNKRVADMESAYDVWLNDGHTGSMSEFLIWLTPAIEFEINNNGELEVMISGNN